MKKSQVRLSVLLFVLVLFGLACKKGGQSSTSVPSTLTFQTTDSSFHFPVTLAAVQEVDTLHTTLISGGYADTSSNQGNISIRVIGDTTLTYKATAVLVTYVDWAGNSYTSNGDSTDYVTITKFQKTANGTVTGSFAVTVTGTMGTITLSNGQFIAPFLD